MAPLKRHPASRLADLVTILEGSGSVTWKQIGALVSARSKVGDVARESGHDAYVVGGSGRSALVAAARES